MICEYVYIRNYIDKFNKDVHFLKRGPSACLYPKYRAQSSAQ